MVRHWTSKAILGLLHPTLNRVRNWALTRPLRALFFSLVLLGSTAFILTLLLPWAPQLSDLLTGLFTGLAASLATYSAIQFFFLEQKTLGIRQWLDFGKQPIWVVPTYFEMESPKHFPMKYYVIPTFDAQSAGILTTVTGRAGYRFPKRKITGSLPLEDRLLRDNLILLCLPERNIYTRIFLGLFYELYYQKRQAAFTAEDVAKYRDDVECKRDYLFLDKNLQDGQLIWRMRHFDLFTTVTSTMNEHPDDVNEPGRVSRDYALLIKAPNPLNSTSTVVVVCGIHGVGTYGGCLFLYKHEPGSLFRKYPDRAQAHLLEVRYTLPEKADNYLESEVLTPIKEVCYKSLG